MPRITPNLWFDLESVEAAEFYVSIFPNSEITTITHYGEDAPRPAGTVLTVNFVLDGQEFTAINGGDQFTFDEAISLAINCADQDEIDYYWAKLTEGGGEEGPCGWLQGQVRPLVAGRARGLGGDDDRPRQGPRPTRDAGDVPDEEARHRRPPSRRRRQVGVTPPVRCPVTR